MIEIKQKYSIRKMQTNPVEIEKGNISQIIEKEITLPFRELRFDVYEDKRVFLQYLEYSKNMDVGPNKVKELIKSALLSEAKYSESDFEDLLKDHKACFALLIKISNQIINPYMGELNEL